MVSKKITLHSIGNDGNFNYYIFDKKREVHVVLNGLFKRIFKVTWYFQLVKETKKGSVLVDVDITKKIDVHEKISSYLSKEKARIDIFFGGKKIFVCIHCSQNLRKKFNEELEKISFMIKPKLGRIKK